MPVCVAVARAVRREPGVQAQTISRYARDTGNINFVTTGGSLRNAPNAPTPARVNTTSTQTLSGIPATRTVRNAYLYWGASGNTADTSVTLNGTTVTASRTFARTFNNGTAFNFFGAFADVTSLVTPPATATTRSAASPSQRATPWCGSQAVVGGWALIVIYEGAAERLRAINLYDGLDYFYGSQVTQTPERLPRTRRQHRRPHRGVHARRRSAELRPRSDGVSEALRFNGTLLDDGIVPAGSDPVVQQFDGTISTQGSVTSYGIDVDQYDVSALLLAGPDQRHHGLFRGRGPGVADGADRQRDLRSGGGPRRHQVAHRHVRLRRHRAVHHHRVERPGPASSAKTTSSR